MRSLALAAVAASFLFAASAVQAESYCVSGCDTYSNPEYSPPEISDDGGYDRDYRYSAEQPRYQDEGFDEETSVGEPVYADEPQQRYHRRSQRSYRHSHGDPYAGRTEFCRETVEKRGGSGWGWGSKKVKVRRCVWVRNDLVPNHRADSGSISGW